MEFYLLFVEGEFAISSLTKSGCEDHIEVIHEREAEACAMNTYGLSLEDLNEKQRAEMYFMAGQEADSTDIISIELSEDKIADYRVNGEDALLDLSEEDIDDRDENDYDPVYISSIIDNLDEDEIVQVLENLELNYEDTILANEDSDDDDEEDFDDEDFDEEDFEDEDFDDEDFSEDPELDEEDDDSNEEF